MKKYVTLCTMLLMLLVLAACDSGDAPIATPAATVSTTAPVTTAATEPETEPSTTEAEKQVDAWVFPDSDQRYLTADELENLPAVDLATARNEILARNGCIFSDPAVADYFTAQSWYVPEIPEDQFSGRYLNEFERSNSYLMELYEKMRAPSFNPGNPYETCYDKERPYVISTSHDTPLIEADYLGLSVEMTYIAWNEILARHGYVSDDQVLMEYFIHHSWYRPNTPIGDDSGIVLSDVEQENIRILKEYQQETENKGLDMAYTNTVSCDYFTVTTPAFWAEYGLVQTEADRITFREKAAHEAGMGGHVFTLQLYNGAEEYNQMPQWKLLGTLTDSNGKSLHLVAIYPSDVQFDLENGDMYMRMDRGTDGVIDTITAAEGCNFTPAE